MAAPRFVVVDENISATGGHYLELAGVILREAAQRGYAPHLWTARAFSPSPSPSPSPRTGDLPPWQVRPTFACSKMRRWSLGVDGHSRWRRGADGRVAAGPWPLRSLVRMWEAAAPHPPADMLRAWCQDFRSAIEELAPQPDDRILLSTADDFTLLALASALRSPPTPQPLRLDVLFHLSLLPGRPGQPNAAAIQRQFADQTADALDCLRPHQVRLWATTAELAEQLNTACGRALWQAIDYPIRGAYHDAGVGRRSTAHQRRRLLLGGGVRTEKGKYSIGAAVDALWPEFLQSGRWQLAMQLPDKAAQRLLPRHLRGGMPQYRAPGRAAPLRLAAGVLDDAAYARWITSADAGLFLYDGCRYFARCSGVLVEMLAAGVPVIVPAASWLSRQISPRMYEHLDAVARDAQPAGEPVALDRKGGSLTAHWRDQRAALLIGFAGPRAVGDCVAVTAQPLTAGGRPLGTPHRWILDERPQGPMRVLVRQTPGAAATRISYGPAFSYGAAVDVPDWDWLDQAATPESAVGLIAAAPDQLARLIGELESHHDHYRRTASLHAVRWARRHSAAAFLDALQVAPLHDAGCAPGAAA